MTGRAIALLSLLFALFFFSCNFMEPAISPEEELMRSLERIIRETPEKGGRRTKKATVVRLGAAKRDAVRNGTENIRGEKKE